MDGTNGIYQTGTTPLFFVDGGSNSAYANNAVLHTFSSKWTSSVKVAFEATIWSTGTTVYSALYDASTSSGTLISGSTVSTTATTATVIRSSQFTITSGKPLAVAWYGSSSGQDYYICDASLIIFP